MNQIHTLMLTVMFSLAAFFGLATSAQAARTETDAVKPVGGNDGRQKQFLERGKDKKIGVVFLGDSITDGWQGGGKKVWDEYYTKYDAADFGVSGERTEQVLGRIEHGLLEGLSPKVVVIMIGTNNIGHFGEEKPEWAAAGVKKIVDVVHEKLPESSILLLGVFPRGNKDGADRKKVTEINEIISKFDDGKKTRYLDISAKFLDEKGELPHDIMPDKLHPNEKGYKIWAEAMQPLLDEMMK